MPIRSITAARSGERTNATGKAIKNRLLLSLPDHEFQLLRPHLQFLHMAQHATLHDAHQVVNFVHFPNSGLISLVIDLRNGKSVEAGLLGRDGAAGITFALGKSRSSLKEIVQIEGDAFRIKSASLRDVLPSTPQFRSILNGYAAELLMQIAQTAACNRLHKIEERLARWLLVAQDQLDAGTIRLTHDFLAIMLGTDRSSVTFAAGILQKAAAIQYSRAAVKVKNRKKLETLACECYSMVKEYSNGTP